LSMDTDLFKTTEIEILRHLAERGHDVRLMAYHTRKRHREKGPELKVTSLPLRYVPNITPLLFNVILILILPLYVLTHRPDIIITEPGPSITGLLPLIPFSRLKRVKLVLDIRSVPVEFFGFKGVLEDSFFNLSVRVARDHFDGMTIITPKMRDEICGRFGIDPGWTGVWTSGVDASIFDPEPYSTVRDRTRRALGLEDKFVVFYHGSLTENRGIHEAIEAVSIINSEYPDTILFLLGGGLAKKDLKEHASRRGLQENVIIHDEVEYEEVPRYISMSDVCIIPLPDSPFWRHQSPLKLFEYLAMGKVVIATDIPAHRSVMEEGRSIIYIPSSDPLEVAKALVEAYEHRGLLEAWGEGGRELVEARYSWERLAGDLEDYLLSI